MANKEIWRSWDEFKQLTINLRLLLDRPNGRRIAAHLVDITGALLEYKANREGTWSYGKRKKAFKRPAGDA
jgi:hypothetical protein